MAYHNMKGRRVLPVTDFCIPKSASQQSNMAPDVLTLRGMVQDTGNR